MDEYQQVIWEQVIENTDLVLATFSGQQRGQTVPWKKVNLRPVHIKNQSYIQFSYFDERQNVTKNYRADGLVDALRDLLSYSFSNFHIMTTHTDWQIRITKKGKALISQQPANRPIINLSHDRLKQLPLVADQPDTFLQAIGIMTQDGRVKATMQHKFKQINEFLRLTIDEIGGIEQIELVDCGCGSAHLTFATHHYLNDVLKIPTHTVGVDVRERLLRERQAIAEQLGWQTIEFVTSTIIDFAPTIRPNVVLALHACDTATDEALAQAIQWGSDWIFSAPCCHHHLQAQLKATFPFEPVMRHGILFERMGDALTDAFRALILRIMGYQTQVIEFVTSEHTAKNLMIRAARVAQPGESQFVDEYLALKAFWGVTPYLETLLGERFLDLVTFDGQEHGAQ
ncbi:MAG: SAM-dependent methyltransferase [Anaerolineales bacterium]|nr:SAM-dependent methyltransferase [Anaerolineales bacterium]